MMTRRGLFAVMAGVAAPMPEAQQKSAEVESFVATLNDPSSALRRQIADVVEKNSEPENPGS